KLAPYGADAARPPPLPLVPPTTASLPAYSPALYSTASTIVPARLRSTGSRPPPRDAGSRQREHLASSPFRHWLPGTPAHTLGWSPAASGAAHRSCARSAGAGFYPGGRLLHPGWTKVRHLAYRTRLLPPPVYTPPHEHGQAAKELLLRSRE